MRNECREREYDCQQPLIELVFYYFNPNTEHTNKVDIGWKKEIRSAQEAVNRHPFWDEIEHPCVAVLVLRCLV